MPKPLTFENILLKYYIGLTMSYLILSYLILSYLLTSMNQRIIISILSVLILTELLLAISMRGL